MAQLEIQSLLTVRYEYEVWNGESLMLCARRRRVVVKCNTNVDLQWGHLWIDEIERRQK